MESMDSMESLESFESFGRVVPAMTTTTATNANEEQQEGRRRGERRGGEFQCRDSLSPSPAAGFSLSLSIVPSTATIILTDGGGGPVRDTSRPRRCGRRMTRERCSLLGKPYTAREGDRQLPFLQPNTRCGQRILVRDQVPILLGGLRFLVSNEDKDCEN